MGWNRQRVIAIAILAIVVFAVVKVTGHLGDSAATDSAPSCAKPENQKNMGVTPMSQCLTDVQSWCAKNYPKDDLCANRVYGYAPGKPGDSDEGEYSSN